MKSMLPCFEIRSSPECGLGLYARRDIAEGEAVLEELPFATSVAVQHDTSSAALSASGECHFECPS